MKDPDLQFATASEPLTISEEYAMQESWRADNDKLTFISCVANESRQGEIERMLGDINLFISIAEEEDESLSLVGELELMIAMNLNQGHGFGRVTLLVFLRFVLAHQSEILQEFFSNEQSIQPRTEFDYLRVKINETNQRSIHLFESLDFRKTKDSANVFGEYELRKEHMKLVFIDEEMRKKNVDEYAEIRYHVPLSQGRPANLDTSSASSPLSVDPSSTPSSDPPER